MPPFPLAEALPSSPPPPITQVIKEFVKTEFDRVKEGKTSTKDFNLK